MIDYQKYINALRKCAKEHENDRTFTGHIAVTILCQDTANLLEALEQEPILDKIRAEIIERDRNVKAVRSDACCIFTAEEVLAIIDMHSRK